MSRPDRWMADDMHPADLADECALCDWLDEAEGHDPDNNDHDITEWKDAA